MQYVKCGNHLINLRILLTSEAVIARFLGTHRSYSLPVEDGRLVDEPYRHGL